MDIDDHYESPIPPQLPTATQILPQRYESIDNNTISATSVQNNLAIIDNSDSVDTAIITPQSCNINITESNTAEIEVKHPLCNTTKIYRKKLYDKNNQSMLHRWIPPYSSVYNVEASPSKDYFVQDKTKSSSYINSLQSLQTSQEIITYLTSTETIHKLQLKKNYAYNILDTNNEAIFEARIITCFYDKYKTNNTVLWDLLVEEVNMHLYVTTSLLIKLMRSNFTATIMTFNLATNRHITELGRNLRLHTKKQTTMLLSIDKHTLDLRFNYNKNVIELTHPKIDEKSLIFHPNPYHVGKDIKLTSQSKNFEMEDNTNVIKMHGGKKRRVYQGKLIVVCQKKQLEEELKNANIRIHFKFILISKHTKEKKIDTLQSHEDDEYVILLVAVNPRKNVKPVGSYFLK